MSANSVSRPQRAAGKSGKPRILLVGPFPPTKGGITTFLLNLMSSQLASEFDFVPFTTSRPPKKNVTENWGYRAILRGGVPRILVGIAVTLWHLVLFPFVVVTRRISIVQVQASDYLMFWEGLLYVIMARLLRRKVLFRLGGAFDVFHGTATRFEQRLLAAALRVPDYLIVQSRYARDYIRGAGRTGPMTLLPNWTPDANIADTPRQPNASPICLFIANSEAKRKGVDQVFAAAAILQASGCPVRFHFLAMPERLIQQLQALNLNNVAAIESFVPHERVLQVMRQSEIFLLPSHAEGFPNSLVEAMAAGMACIATPVGAVPEMTSNGEAIVIPVGNAMALANAIEQIASNPSLFRTLAAKAQEKVRTCYTANAALPDLAAAYRARARSTAVSRPGTAAPSTARSAIAPQPNAGATDRAQSRD